MSPIIAGMRISPVYIAPLPTPASADNSPRIERITAIPSTTVSLGQNTNNGDARTYSSRGVIDATQVRYALEKDSQDKLSARLISGIQTASIGSRLQGLGAAILEQLAANGGQSISQSVFALDDGVQPSAEALKLKGDMLRQSPANAVSLSLTTASGATVTLSLASNEQGLAVSADVQGGQLTTEELEGLGALADSFQGAIDGLNEEPPRLQLGKLATLDPALFSSLKMSAKLDTLSGEQQTFDLNLDDTARTLSVQGPSGNVQMNLDNRDSSLLGSSAQRHAAISNYLSQFDAAQRRGDGDETLVSLFKDAFVQLNSANDAGATATDRIPVLAANDRALLSGLADFSASISQTTQRINPLQPGETDRFDYKVSQSTTTRGAAHSSRSVQQDQQASLTAAYHSNVKLPLDNDPESQNYRYHEVSDQSSSSTRLVYDKNRLVEASATQQASQNERVRTYVKGDLTDDVSTPKSASASHNLLDLLDDAFQRERTSLKQRGVSILEEQLQSQRGKWLLQSDPAGIRG